MKAEKNEQYSFANRLRVRVCGILILENKILLVKHKSITKLGTFWAPPGGGLEFGETTEHALKREFLEETGLEIEVVKFLFVNEFLNPPLHGIELFFEVKKIGGILKTGHDPELDLEHQIIEETRFVDLEELSTLWHSENYHAVLKNMKSNKKIFYVNGV